MNPRLLKIYKAIKAKGLSKEQDEKVLSEIRHAELKEISEQNDVKPVWPEGSKSFYAYHDLLILHDMTSPQHNYTSYLKSLDELLERDKQREKDGFPRKIRVGQLIKPGKGKQNKVVVVPSTVEEKLLHDNTFRPPDQDDGTGGSGEGEEGEVIGEQTAQSEEGEGAGPGQGSGGSHEMESNAYDLGKILTEKFELPNLKDKGKKRSLTRYTYDLTDRNRGVGQILDKKATLKQIIETNIHLGNIPDLYNIDSTRFIISPKDKIYRILSREKDYESQAMVFFLRDYSGSMAGKPTDIVVAQHVLIYSWILYQYEKQVESRFILHDTEAKEVPDFDTYYRSKVAGGTRVASAFRLLNEIVEKENLAADYNIYVFHGTDGDDWDVEGKETIPEIKKMLNYVSRAGISVIGAPSASLNNTEVERYINKSGFLKDYPKLIRMDVMDVNADEPRLIDGIKKLISE
jgi:uncharacterized protein